MPSLVYIAIIALLVVLYAYSQAQKQLLYKQYLDLQDKTSNTDTLTGLYNRQFFTEYYKAESNRTLAYMKNSAQAEDFHFFAIVLFQIRNFEELTLTYGKVWGDEAIKQVACKLKELVFNRDLICRYEDNQFAVLFTHTNNHDPVLQKTSLIQNQIEQLPIKDPLGKGVKLEVAVGTAFFNTDYTMGDLFSVLRSAEQKLKQPQTHNTYKETSNG